MLKIPSKVSIMLSITIAVVLFAACIAAVFFLPTVTDMLVEARNSMGYEIISGQGRDMLVVLAYVALSFIIVADILLFCLLVRVNKGKVFTEKSVDYIREVSWCCFALSATFCVIGLYFNLAFAVALLGVFLGLCLRVVKNVIEEATIIKSENDLTV